MKPQSGQNVIIYKRKAKQVIDATLEEIAPQDHDHLFRSVSQVYASTMNLDSTLMEAIKECYANADHRSTRRQILSVVADKMSFKEIETWIPDLSRYRYNIARHHRLLHGRGAVVPISTSTRMYVEPEKLDHFLSFITSTHIVQDLPFGEKSLKLSSSAVIKVPNVIRSIIPEHIIEQYKGYCRESVRLYTDESFYVMPYSKCLFSHSTQVVTRDRLRSS